MLCSLSNAKMLTGCSMLNSQGRSFSFDLQGSGYGRRQGVVSTVLKRLEHAMGDGDPVSAVIRGTGIDQDGKAAGITRANAASQQLLIKRVHQQNQIDPARICYVEAHATGTKEGDEWELEALASAICANRDSKLWGRLNQIQHRKFRSF